MKKYIIPALLILAPSQSFAHALAGDRVFPATLATEDPGVSDEFNLQSQGFKGATDDGVNAWTTENSFEYDKRITQNLGLSVEGAYINQSNDAGNGDGFDNFGLGLKYQAFVNAEHEAILSIGLDADIGGTGSHHIGAESYSTFTPTAYFGKGFGDLPDSLDYLKPFALTGSFGYSIPSSGKSDNTDELHPNTLQYGLALEYSLPYLQQHVKDIGLGAPFNNLVPVIELQLEQPIDRSENHALTGTVNPGLIWMGHDVQFGLEATLPFNDRSGSGVGFIAQLHFYLDDLFPTTLGKPVW